MREPIVKIGVFADELQRIIDTEFQCYPLEKVLDDPHLRGKVRGIITRNLPIAPAVLDFLPALKIVATSSVGYDALPVKYARERGVVITNTPGVLDSAVCELAIGLLLSLLRKIPSLDRYVREGQWAIRGQYPLTTGLAGKTVGIVGLGRIGRGIANRLAPFDVEIAYTGPRTQDTGYRYVTDLLELAAAVDILFICCRGGQATYRLIDANVLRALGPEGYLVNISRGSVIDEQALVHALESGGIRGAALDVFENEPLATSSLFGLSNTVLTPHVGSATCETRAVMLRLTLDNLLAVFEGNEPITPI
jgi:lactate dehydrogenase-like 2-hydroxyacid dehydrogenase